MLEVCLHLLMLPVLSSASDTGHAPRTVRHMVRLMIFDFLLRRLVRSFHSSYLSRFVFFLLVFRLWEDRHLVADLFVQRCQGVSLGSSFRAYGLTFPCRMKSDSKFTLLKIFPMGELPALITSMSKT